MALPPVDVSDVVGIAAAYGITITDAQEPGVALLIEKAQGLLPAATEARIADGRLSASVAVSVVEDMVVRVLRNLRGLRQVSIDDYSATIDSAISTGQLYLAADELARLSGSRRRRFGSMQVGLPTYRVP